MGTMKDRNGMDLTEAEDIKRWQEYTGELYKKDLHDQDNHNGVITDLEPNILECEVKWALESITTNKASEGDGIPVELFQILKDDAVKVLHSICQQIRKTQQWPQDLVEPWSCYASAGTLDKSRASFELFTPRACPANVRTARRTAAAMPAASSPASANCQVRA